LNINVQIVICSYLIAILNNYGIKGLIYEFDKISYYNLIIRFNLLLYSQYVTRLTYFITVCVCMCVCVCVCVCIIKN